MNDQALLLVTNSLETCNVNVKIKPNMAHNVTKHAKNPFKSIKIKMDVSVQETVLSNLKQMIMVIVQNAKKYYYPENKCN